MPRHCEVFISKAAFDYLDTLEYWDRVRILDFLERLRQQPFRAREKCAFGLGVASRAGKSVSHFAGILREGFSRANRVWRKIEL